MLSVNIKNISLIRNAQCNHTNCDSAIVLFQPHPKLVTLLIASIQNERDWSTSNLVDTALRQRLNRFHGSSGGTRTSLFSMLEALWLCPIVVFFFIQCINCSRRLTLLVRFNCIIDLRRSILTLVTYISLSVFFYQCTYRSLPKIFISYVI